MPTWHGTCDEINARPLAGRREKEGTMKFMIKWGLALIPALALATPAFAHGPAQIEPTPSSREASSSSPNSSTSSLDGRRPLIVDGQLVAQTEIEIGAVCPPAFVARRRHLPRASAGKDPLSLGLPRHRRGELQHLPGGRLRRHHNGQRQARLLGRRHSRSTAIRRRWFLRRPARAAI